MARFEGVGALIHDEGKVYDFEFDNDGGLQIGGGVVRSCLFGAAVAIVKTTSGPLEVLFSKFANVVNCIEGAASGDGANLSIIGCNFDLYEKVLVTTGSNNNSIRFIGNRTDVAIEALVALELVGCQGVIIADNEFIDPWGAINVDATSQRVSITGNVFRDYSGEVQSCIHSEADYTTIVGNLIETDGSSDDMGAITIDGVTSFLIGDNLIVTPDGHGIEITGSEGGVVKGNQIEEPGAGGGNTFDGIIITGGSEVLVVANQIRPRLDALTTRYGINIVSGSNHAVYANFLGDSSEYGTADSADGGTATQTAPAGGAIGGQFAF